MIAERFANEGTRALAVVVPSEVLSNPMPRLLPAGAREGLTPSASEPGVDA